LLESPTDFQNQRFKDIQKQCQNSGTVFEDAKFPANAQSLFSVDVSDNSIRWDRIKTISESPCLLIREKRSRELCHGSLGTCWVPAVAAALLIWPEYAEKAMPDLRSQEQELLDPVRFTGAFHFRLHFNDEPYRVVIDDRLPRSASSSSPSSSMLFAHSPDSGEYFAPLLEKAIAKLFGSYRALESLTLEQGLECATGGLCHSVSLSASPDLVANSMSGGAAMEKTRVSVFERLQTELEQRSLLLLKVAPASVDAAESPASSDPHSETKHGLVPCHAYLATGTRCVAADPLRFQDLVQMAQQRGDPRRRHRFVRVRNPAGQRRGAWRGPWSEGSSEMASLSDAELDRYGFAYDDDSDSWMSLADLFENFSELIVCRVHNLSVLSMRNTWHEAVFRGSWTEWLSGGCLEKGGRPLTNPQYMLDVTNPNLELDISLSQRFEATPHDLVSMGLLLVKVESNREYRAHRLDFCQVVHHTACSSAQRITLGLHLEPGRYILLPCTEIASQEAFFTLRIYSRGASCNARELVADQPPASLCFAFTAYPEVGTRVLVLSARGLPRLVLGANPYCQVFFEGGGSKARTRALANTSDPEWNEPLVFYRRTDQRVISFEIRSERAVVDAFLAHGQIDQDEWFKGGDGVQELQLYGHRQISGAGSPMRPNKTERVRLAAKLFVQIFSTNDLLYI
ncbi:hypothetical protein BOX15_Mlig011943g2, partial [Macrostomum lignano]